jgi:hypothetical protein
VSFFNELKRRNVFRVAAVYAVISWLLMQVGDVMFPALRLPEWSTTMLVAFLLLGFPVALVLAWAYERTPEGIKRSEDVDLDESITQITGRRIDLIIIAVIAVAVIFLVGRAWLQDPGATEIVASNPGESTPYLPLVVMMDSHYPKRVYDEETLAAGGTNADVVSDILLDLPIRRQKEAVGPEWHRDEDILGFRPDLVIVHYSAFRQEDSTGPRTRLRLFVEFFTETDTRFLIYSRWNDADLRQAMEELLADLDKEHPGLLERVYVFGLLSHGEPHWNDPVTAASLKLLAKRILETD